MSLRDQQRLEATQETVAKHLMEAAGTQLGLAKLCGGTALSRFYLHHRLSYDLDFFLPEFRPTKLLMTLRRAGIKHKVLSVRESEREASQLHLFVGSDPIKVSFIEDAYFDVFPPVEQMLGALRIRTETIEGLYHRKLRTVSGHVTDGKEPIGSRQIARDLFDLWVLSKEHAPIMKFIKSLPYEFPEKAFKNGLADMPWFNLIPEFNEIAATPKWPKGCDVEVVRTQLMIEIDNSSRPTLHEKQSGPPRGKELVILSKSEKDRRGLWDRIRRQGFWDRNVEFDFWMKRVLEGHPSYLPQSVDRFDAEDFSCLLGHSEFIQHWPRIRTLLDQTTRRNWAFYDVLWSRLATQTFNVKPLPAWFDLTPREREFLMAVAKRPGRGTYEIAKEYKMQYRRAFDYFKQLVAAGFIRAVETRRNGRRVQLLYPY